MLPAFLESSEFPLGRVILKVYGKRLSEEDAVTILSSCSILGEFISSAKHITTQLLPEATLEATDSSSSVREKCPVLQEINFTVRD